MNINYDESLKEVGSFPKGLRFTGKPEFTESSNLYSLADAFGHGMMFTGADTDAYSGLEGGPCWSR